MRDPMGRGGAQLRRKWSSRQLKVEGIGDIGGAPVSRPARRALLPIANQEQRPTSKFDKLSAGRAAKRQRTRDATEREESST